MRKNTILKLLFITLLSFILISCKKQDVENKVELLDTAIIHDEKFGGFYVDISIEDFNALGFEYGDSVDLVLSTGDKLEDIPYYNGYYTKTYEPLICAYPGYAHIKVQANNGDDLYITYNMNDSTTASVTLNQEGKYLAVQQAMDTVYKNDRESFYSDEVFANYRVMKGGKLKENIFYRSASPMDNEYNRAAYTDALMEKDGIKTVLNLSDTIADVEDYISKDDFKSFYTKSLYEQGKVITLGMGSSYRSDAFKQKVVEGFNFVLENEGPYLIHCVEGKDRTGFMAILIESLCNATYDEMLEDYMITYDNYYQINKDNKVDQYNAIIEIKFEDMMFYLADVNSKEEMASVNIQQKASEYLQSAGMANEQIKELIELLSE